MYKVCLLMEYNENTEKTFELQRLIKKTRESLEKYREKTINSKNKS